MRQSAKGAEAVMGRVRTEFAGPVAQRRGRGEWRTQDEGVGVVRMRDERTRQE